MATSAILFRLNFMPVIFRFDAFKNEVSRSLRPLLSPEMFRIILAIDYLGFSKLKNACLAYRIADSDRGRAIHGSTLIQVPCLLFVFCGYA